MVRLLLIVIPVLVIAIDQISKYFAVTRLADGSFPIWEDILHFTYVKNTGAAFGILRSAPVLLLILPFIILAGILLYIILKKPKGIIQLPLGLIIGGAVGNLIDRIFRGYVVDFIDFRVIDYPVFNVADICIVCGAVLLLFFVWRSDNKEEDERDE